MTTNSAAPRRPGRSARATRLAGATLLAAATALSGSAHVPPREPVADNEQPTPAVEDLPATTAGLPAPAPPGAPPVVPAATIDLGFTRTGGVQGVPASVLAAYRNAETTLAAGEPGCHVRTELLAAIGRVESGHARGGRVDGTGRTVDPILGPVLAGGLGFAAIRDTDGGRLDGDTAWDRAVGPMQFIPGTWARWRADGNGDGVADPHNVFDASLAAGRYLCAGGRDLDRPADLDQAVLSYNNSTSYLRLVLAWMRAYAAGLAAIPDGTGYSGVPDVPSGPDAPDGDTAVVALPAPAPPLGTAPPAPGTGMPAPAPQLPGTTPPGTPPTTTPQTPPSSDDPPQPPPTTTPPPAPADPPAPGPVTALVCTVGSVLSGIGSLLGAPPPANDDCP